MKLDNKYIEVVGGLGEKSIKSTISQEKLGKLWDMLQNPYKNNIGSIVREITSNCFDSHTEAQVEDAVRIKFSKDESNFYVSFIDVGIGMSPDRVESIYSTYLESTKEESDDFIGCFGIGSKSPLSYQDVFYIITRYDGTEYKYMMRKGADGPVIDLINSKLTSERNGTEIKIYIKNEADLARFLSETITQLHYFNNVVVDIDDIDKIYNGNYYSSYTKPYEIVKSLKILSEYYNIIEGDTFKYRTNTQFTSLHMCIGTVYYPIDYQNLGMARVDLPLALKFDIGELSVIQTREDVRYTDEVIVKIKNKIQLLKQEILDKINKKAEEEYTLTEYVTETPFSQVNFKLSDTISLNVSSFIDISKLTAVQIKDFPVKFDSIVHNKQFYLYFLDKHIASFTNKPGSDYSICNAMFRGVSVDKTFNSNLALKAYNSSISSYLPTNFSNKANYLSFNNILTSLNHLSKTGYKIIKANEGKYSVKKNKYLLEELEGFYASSTVLATIPDKMPKLTYTHLKNIYSDYKVVVKDSSFKEFMSVLNFIGKHIKNEVNNLIALDYDKLVVPEKWWKKYKAENYTTAEYDRTLMAFDRLNNYNVDWNRKDYRYNVEDFLKLKGINIVITKEEQSNLCSNNTDYGNTPLEKMIKYIEVKGYIKTSVNLYATATRNYDKIMKARGENSNIYSLKEFLSDTKMQKRILSKVATLVKIETHIRKFNTETRGVKFSDLSDILGIMNDQLQNDYKEISRYVDTHESNLRSLFNTGNLEDLMKEFDDIHVNNIVYDSRLVTKLNNILKFVAYSKIHCISHDVVSIKHFIDMYKADKVYHTLHPALLKSNLSSEDIFKVRFGNIEKISDWTLQNLKDEVYYDSYINQFNKKVSYHYNSRDLPESNRLLCILLIMKFEEEVDFTIPEDDVVFTVTAPVVTDEEEVVEEVVEETIDLNV